jgi:hypothetical protein
MRSLGVTTAVSLACVVLYTVRGAGTSQQLLRITVQEKDTEIEITLEGRVAGPWVAELRRIWMETTPRLGARKLSLDLRNVTYSDAGGEQVLREIFAQTNAELVTSTPWTQYLAEQIKNSKSTRI